MPALLLHMTLAKQLKEKPGLPRPFYQAIHQAQGALLLGSILPDLPYHFHFGIQLYRHFTKQEFLLSEWGDVFHTRGTGQLPLAFLRYINRMQLSTADELEVLALLAGYLSHHAADRLVHPVIQMMVKTQSAQEATPPSLIHMRLERYQNLLYHIDRLGYEMFCTSFPRRCIRQMAGAGLLWPQLPAALYKALRAACLEVHGRAPSKRDIQDWLFGTTAYGELMSSPFAAHEKLEKPAEVIRKESYQGPGVDLLTPLNCALNETVKDLQAAWEVLQADKITHEVSESFLKRVKDVDLAVGC